MKISVELSYYPLNEGYVEPILEFLQKLNEYTEMKCVTNGMSTQVFGDFDYVMDALKIEIRNSFINPSSVFVLKIVNLDLR